MSINVSRLFFNKTGTCTKDEFIYLGELEIGMNKKEKYIGLDEQYVEVTLEGCKNLCIGLHFHTCGAVAYHVKVCGCVCRSIGQLMQFVSRDLHYSVSDSAPILTLNRFWQDATLLCWRNKTQHILTSIQHVQVSPNMNCLAQVKVPKRAGYISQCVIARRYKP